MKFKELNEYYKSLYDKDIPRSTLTKWVKEGRVKAKKQENRLYDYDFESFKSIIESEDYKKNSRIIKENPNDYINKICNKLLITGVVPKTGKDSETYMYCTCLKCGRQNVKVKFKYLSNNSNYSPVSCGCLRKERAFLASSRKDLTYEHLELFKEDFEKFLLVHKILIKNTDKYYTSCPIDEYVNALKTIYFDKQFNAIYKFWKIEEKTNTFYDWAKPSLDHIVPKSKGGGNNIENL